jgi:hypothetical protein
MFIKVILSETPYYKAIDQVKTDTNINYKDNTPQLFQVINPIYKGTDYYNRFGGINILYIQSVMDDNQFKRFVDFIGEETIGVRPQDLAVYYPDE